MERAAGGRRARALRAVMALVLVGAAVITVVVVLAQDGNDASTAGTGPGDESTTTGQPTTTTTAPPAIGPDQATLDAVGLKLTPIVELLHPTAVAQRPGTTDLYVTGLEGPLVRAPLAGGRSETVADLHDQILLQGEGGLLDLAFNADGTVLYLSMVVRSGALEVHSVPMDGIAPVLREATVLISIESPSTVHFSGHLYLDPEGMLWLSVGDGGPSQEPSLRAQDLLDLHGKILRLDPAHPSGGKAYGIPADNPFVGRADAAPEVWAYGLRNPWRYWVDEPTGALWIGDVGRHAAEEVDYVAGPGRGAGSNFGWPHLEGDRPVIAGGPEGLVAPLLIWPHGDRCAVTGGVVYRGDAIPELAGAYLFSDLCDGIVRAATVVDGAVVAQRAFDTAAAGYPVSFGVDAHGEAYFCSFDMSRVYRIDPA